jgi:hypothetical protein
MPSSGMLRRVAFVRLNHCATSRKVVGSIPDMILDFSLPNPSSRIVAPGDTQPLTDMSTRNLPGGIKGGSPTRRHRNFSAKCKYLPASTSHSPMDLHGLLGDSFTFLYVDDVRTSQEA